MATNTTNILHHVFKYTLAVLLALSAATASPAPDANIQRRDSLQRRHATTLQTQGRREIPDLRHRMMSSPQPVEIRQQGRNLCVTSSYNQLLPIYTASGTLYSSFRLSKGTNWLSGLPRGSYIINNHKYTIN